MITTIILIYALAGIVYCFLIGFFTIGWYKKPQKKAIYKTDYPFISVIIPFRNEAPNLNGLIQDLKSQNYPTERFEVLLSDDFSDDNSNNIIRHEILELENFFLIPYDDKDDSGKKAAIERALTHAKGDVIVFTDADCKMGYDWLKSIGNEFMDTGLQMLLAPVDIEYSTKSIFKKLQSLEFLSLIGVTGGSANMSQPVMANGANMAIRKKIMPDARKKMKGKNLLSGDDIFLLHAVKKLYPGKIRFLKSRKSIVKTKPSNSLKEFFSQRVRWSSKSSSYRDSFTVLSGSLVATVNIMIVILVIGLIFYPLLLKPIVILWSFKLIADFLLIAGVAKFIGKINLLWWYVPLQVLYPFYVTITLIMAVFTKTNWKNRIQN